MLRLFTQLKILLFIVCFLSCRSTNYLASVESSRQSLDLETVLTEDTTIDALIQPYRTQLNQQMNQEIGQTATDLKKQRPESTLGNWMADAIQRQTEHQLGRPIAFAIQNYGGIRIPEIKKGAISRGRIYELMPFDNTIVILSLNKEEVTELVQHMINGGGWPVSYSINIIQNSSKELDILIHKEPLKDGEKYEVALPDYVANGGSDAGFLRGKPQNELTLYIRDALIADIEGYTTNNQKIESKIEGRIIIHED